MTEIEKLYENVKIFCLHPSGFCKYIGATCEVCERHKYPPFTAEKQLELIKFLFQKSVYYDVDDKNNYWFHISDDCYTYYYSKFEVALANIINEMWKDLTKEEQQQIKEILK